MQHRVLYSDKNETIYRIFCEKYTINDEHCTGILVYKYQYVYKCYIRSNLCELLENKKNIDLYEQMFF